MFGQLTVHVLRRVELDNKQEHAPVSIHLLNMEGKTVIHLECLLNRKLATLNNVQVYRFM